MTKPTLDRVVAALADPLFGRAGREPIAEKLVLYRRRISVMGNVVKLAACVLISVSAAVADEPVEPDEVIGVPLRGDEAVEFLNTAELVGEPVVFDEAAITDPVRVTLSDGERTYRAIFKHQNTRYPEFRFSDGRVVEDARDSYRHEIAAYELNRMLGLDIVPPCVEREIASKTGSLCFWVEGSMTEAERRQRGLQASNPEVYKQRLLEIELFQQLIADLDYTDLRNLVVDERLRIHKVDSSLAFDSERDLLTGLYSSRLSGRLIEGLEALDKKETKAALKPWLFNDQLSALWERRNRILKRAEDLIDEYGEDEILY